MKLFSSSTYSEDECIDFDDFQAVDLKKDNETIETTCSIKEVQNSVFKTHENENGENNKKTIGYFKNISSDKCKSVAKRLF